MHGRSNECPLCKEGDKYLLIHNGPHRRFPFDRPPDEVTMLSMLFGSPVAAVHIYSIWTVPVTLRGRRRC